MTGEDKYYIFKCGTYKVGRKGTILSVLMLIFLQDRYLFITPNYVIFLHCKVYLTMMDILKLRYHPEKEKVPKLREEILKLNLKGLAGSNVYY